MSNDTPSVYHESFKTLKKISKPKGFKIQFFREFDPGSGRTLAACLTHASRTELFEMKFSDGILDNLVADG